MIRSLREKGFFHLLSVNLLAQALGFGTILVVARFLSPEELGKVKIIQAYTALVIVVATFGYDTAVLKVCSEKRATVEKGAILRLALSRTLIATVATLGVYVLLIAAGLLASSRDVAKWMLIYAITVPFAVVTSILIVYLQALKKIKEMARAQMRIKMQSFVAIVGASWWWGFPGFIFATIGAYIAGLAPLLREIRSGWVTGPKRVPVAGFQRVAFLSVLGTAFGLIGQYADIFILDHFVGDRGEIGYYSLATIIVLAAMQVTATVQSIATPYFSERAREVDWLRNKVVVTQLQMVGLSIGVAVVVYLGARVFVPLIYGPSYVMTLLYLEILLLRYILWSSYAVLGVALLGLGLLGYNLIAAAITTPFGLIVSYLLLQRMGISGVAWAQVIAAGLNLILLLWLTRLGLRRAEKLRHMPLVVPAFDASGTPGGI